MRFTLAVMAASILVSATSCDKEDYHPQKNNKFNCDLQQTLVTHSGGDGSEPGTFSAFRKEYDQSGKVSKVVAGLYTLGLSDSIAMDVNYVGKRAYFTNAKKSNDTLLIATFDSKLNLQRMDVGNANTPGQDFNSTEFFYTGNKLTSFHVAPFAESTKLEYDANGNVIRMYNFENEPSEGTFFTYDRSVSAKRQFYANHFRKSSENTLFLAQFLGWLPDSEPVNKRTSYKIVLHDEDPNDGATPYELISGVMTDHVYDSDGNLTYYKDNSDSYTNIWNCGKKNDLK